MDRALAVVRQECHSVHQRGGRIFLGTACIRRTVCRKVNVAVAVIGCRFGHAVEDRAVNSFRHISIPLCIRMEVIAAEQRTCNCRVQRQTVEVDEYVHIGICGNKVSGNALLYGADHRCHAQSRRIGIFVTACDRVGDEYLVGARQLAKRCHDLRIRLFKSEAICNRVARIVVVGAQSEHEIIGIGLFRCDSPCELCGIVTEVRHSRRAGNTEVCHNDVAVVFLGKLRKHCRIAAGQRHAVRAGALRDRVADKGDTQGLVILYGRTVYAVKARGGEGVGVRISDRGKIIGLARICLDLRCIELGAVRKGTACNNNGKLAAQELGVRNLVHVICADKAAVKGTARNVDGDITVHCIILAISLYRAGVYNAGSRIVGGDAANVDRTCKGTAAYRERCIIRKDGVARKGKGIGKSTACDNDGKGSCDRTDRIVTVCTEAAAAKIAEGTAVYRDRIRKLGNGCNVRIIHRRGQRTAVIIQRTRHGAVLGEGHVAVSAVDDTVFSLDRQIKDNRCAACIFRKRNAAVQDQLCIVLRAESNLSRAFGESIAAAHGRVANENDLAAILTEQRIRSQERADGCFRSRTVSRAAVLDVNGIQRRIRRCHLEIGIAAPDRRITCIRANGRRLGICSRRNGLVAAKIHDQRRSTVKGARLVHRRKRGYDNIGDLYGSITVEGSLGTAVDVSPCARLDDDVGIVRSSRTADVVAAVDRQPAFGTAPARCNVFTDGEFVTHSTDITQAGRSVDKLDIVDLCLAAESETFRYDELGITHTGDNNLAVLCRQSCC